MTAPAVSASAPAIPTINLQDPADMARLPRVCTAPKCGSRIINNEPPDYSLHPGRSTCWVCSTQLAWLVSHPVREPLSPEEWTKWNGPRPGKCTHEGSPLSHQDIRDIRLAYAMGTGTSRQIGERYGLEYTRVRSIIQRRSWRCVP